MATQVRPSGPIPARVMIVGDCPQADEERFGEYFQGYAGGELTKMLHEAGINRSECFLTSVARERPLNNDVGNFIAFKKKDITKDHKLFRDKHVKAQIVYGYDLLYKEINIVKPNLIIALGNVAMWALTGEWGIGKWRGSMLVAKDFPNVKVIPTYPPYMVMRDWSSRAITVLDLRRAAKYRGGEPYPTPKWNFIVRPSYERAAFTLDSLIQILDTGPLEISFDIETRGGHIACAGISWSPVDAICIPLMCIENIEGYWGVEQEAALVHRLFKILTHRNVQVVGQNLLYDSQYTFRHWHFIPRVSQDTMIAFHVMFAGLPKRLDYIASMFCESYRFWKDDGKHWDKKMGESQLWIYNLEDCVRTAECAAVERQSLTQLGLDEVNAFQQELFWPVLKAMIQGVRVDKAARNKMADELLEALSARETYFKFVLGHPLNPRSPKQMQALFYDDLKLPIQYKRVKGAPSRPTLDDEALTKLGGKEPLVRPLLKAIAEYRSIGVFLSTFVQAPLDHDDRMRCSYNICGTETYRFSSSENAFDSGTNLQNLPKGVEAREPEDLSLPNVRKIFIPDYGYTFFDMDLDRADLQVVVWEADDVELKQMLREGVDIHAENAKALGCSRPMAKSWVHGTNYGGSPRTMAINCGLTIKDAERMQKRWFMVHPGIERWHRRTEAQLHSKRSVSNKFGYRRYYFDRVDALLPEALAWIPQSTVACVINRVWVNIHKNLPEVQVLLQVHDSLAGQFPSNSAGNVVPKLLDAARVLIPYDEPLIIPASVKTSTKSWGDCG